MRITKLRYIGVSIPGYFVNGRIYEYLGKEGPFYRIIDESGEVYLYLSLDPFEVVKEISLQKKELFLAVGKD